MESLRNAQRRFVVHGALSRKRVPSTLPRRSFAAMRKRG
jgi:hypothetical protein